jgi:hypothetical protein
VFARTCAIVAPGGKSISINTPSQISFAASAALIRIV